MPVESADGTRVYQSNDRRLIVKEQLIERLFKGIDGMYEIIKTSNNPYNDPRTDFMTQFIMLFVLDEKESIAMMNDRREKVLEATENIKDVNLRNATIGQLNLEYLAKCFELFDNFMGFKKKQVILEVKDGESIKYANELNNTYISRMMACQGDTIDTSGIIEDGGSNETEKEEQNGESPDGEERKDNIIGGIETSEGISGDSSEQQQTECNTSN